MPLDVSVGWLASDLHLVCFDPWDQLAWLAEVQGEVISPDSPTVSLMTDTGDQGGHEGHGETVTGDITSTGRVIHSTQA